MHIEKTEHIARAPEEVCVVYQLESTASGTPLSQLDDIDWKISKLALPIARMMVSRDMARQLASLKRMLDGVDPAVARQT
jgi:hypothetical protein